MKNTNRFSLFCLFQIFCLLLGSSGLLLCSSLTLLLVASNPLHADGGFFGDEEMDLFEPSQKAIIYWRAYTEILIVSSQVKAKRIQDLNSIAWLIPIFSGRKPTVDEADPEIFKTFEEYFPPPIDFDTDALSDDDLSLGDSGGFQVLEQKKIDVYDISILRTTNVSVMLDWLNKNRYFVPQSAKKVLETYVEEGAHYFIANKINLKNELGDDVEKAKEFVELIVKDRSYDRYFKKIHYLCATISEYVDKDVDKLFPDDPSNYHLGSPPTNYGSLTKMIERIKGLIVLDILSGHPYAESIACRQPVKFLHLINEETYEALRFKNKLRKTFADKVLSVFPDKNALIDALTSPLDSRGIPSRSAHWQKTIDVFGSRRKYMSEMKHKFKHFHRAYNDCVAKFDLAMAQSLTRVYNKLKDMMNGMSTPIKINFNPGSPTFPLRISSFHKGETAIELFLCAKAKATDTNKMLEVVDSKEITDVFRKKVSKWLPMPTAKTVTRFRYSGRLSKFTKDALFGKHPDSKE